jgi:acetoacetate decarboxylase
MVVGQLVSSINWESKVNKDEILKLSGMPPYCPSYPRGPYRFINREYLTIAYKSDQEIIRNAVPEPLEPNKDGIVIYEFLRMPDSSGFGDYTESGLVIPCTFGKEEVNYTVQMYLDCSPPITGGREIWGFPKKYALPKLEVVHDTLTGTLIYAGQLVAMGTMGYKRENLLHHGSKYQDDIDSVIAKLSKTQVNLKIIPHVNGSLEVAQLIAYNMTDVEVKGAWVGPARLHLVPHINAPVADFAVKSIIGGSHFIADITLPYGRVIHDYLK